jgi:hypothetical protein
MPRHGEKSAMKFVVRIALSLLATLLAVVATRLIARSRAHVDLDGFPGLA